MVTLAETRKLQLSDPMVGVLVSLACQLRLKQSGTTGRLYFLSSQGAIGQRRPSLQTARALRERGLIDRRSRQGRYCQIIHWVLTTEGRDVAELLMKKWKAAAS